MSAPPHFNPAESLIPDVKGSIGGVQGGGGGQTTFLKDLLTVLKGRVIQYKNPNDMLFCVYYNSQKDDIDTNKLTKEQIMNSDWMITKFIKQGLLQ